jgi:hypothetical protein
MIKITKDKDKQNRWLYLLEDIEVKDSGIVLSEKEIGTLFIKLGKILSRNNVHYCPYCKADLK